MGDKDEKIYQRLNLNIGMGGYIFGNPLEDQIFKQLNHVMTMIIDAVNKYNAEKYGYDGEEVGINIISSPWVADRFVLKFCKDSNSKLICGIPYEVDKMEVEKEYGEEFLYVSDSVTQLDLNPDFPQMSKTNIIGWLIDQSDLSIVLWDGKETASNGEQWNLIQMAREKELPCIWIDVNSPVDVYWGKKGYFDRLNILHINEYMEELLGLNSAGIQYLKELITPVKDENLSWKFFYKSFMKSNRIIKDKVPEDSVMSVDSEKVESLSSSTKARKKLIHYFNTADQAAIITSENYRATIYLRAILPLIITISLAFGFYSETIFGWIFGRNIFGIPNFWGWIAALGFGIHGTLSLFVYFLSKYSERKGWHRSFIGQRYIAESLRLALHFIPFGIPMGDLSLSIYDNKVKRNPEVLRRLRALIRDIGIPGVCYNKELIGQCMIKMEELVDNQLAYHKNTIRQYKKICKRLQTAGNALFFVGVATVVVRGGAQVLLQFIKIEGIRNDIGNLSLIKSAANMFALLLPTIGAHFSLKLSMCNFDGLLSSSENIVYDLSEIKKAIQREQLRDNLCFQNVYRLSKEITRLALGEVSHWYSQLTTKKIIR